MSKGKMKHDLPAVLYVYRESDGEGTYFVAEESHRDLVDSNEARLIGRYDLMRVDQVELTPRRTKVYP